MKKWFVYLLECQDGSYYTGVTNDLDKRMNAHKWQLVDDGRPDIDYMFLDKYMMGYKDNVKNRDLSLRHKLIDDIESFQGSCYFMTKDFFNYLGLLDDVNFGPMGNESQEIFLKCWHAGGRTVVNKKTWYAHARLGRLYTANRDKSRKFILTLAKKYGYKKN